MKTRIEEKNNENGCFNSYQEIDMFLSKELDVEFPLIKDNDLPELNTIEAIKLFAKRYAHKALDEAADKATMKVHDGHLKTDSRSNHVQMGANNVQIDRESILSLKDKY